MLATVCAAVPGAAFSSTAAQADVSNTAAAFGPTRCSFLTNGDLCATGIGGTPGGYDAAYVKYSGPKITVRFYLKCMNGFSKADNGAFSIEAGQRRSFVFAVGNQQECRVQMRDLTNGTYYYSPYVLP